MAKKHYTINENKKTVEFIIGTLTDEEKNEIIDLKTYGYEIIAKQKEKKTGLTYDKMKKQLSTDKDKLKKLESLIDAKTNYLKVRSWFYENTK